MAKFLRRLKDIKIPGLGLIKGLDVTGRIFFRKNLTEDYPKVRPELSDCWRGTFKLDVEDCIACNLCAIDCPNEAIRIKKEKDENNRNKLVDFKINLGYCMFCGICVENCPKKCLKFTKNFETATHNKKKLVLDLMNDRESWPESNYAQPKPKPKPEVEKVETSEEKKEGEKE